MTTHVVNIWQSHTLTRARRSLLTTRLCSAVAVYSSRSDTYLQDGVPSCVSARGAREVLRITTRQLSSSSSID